MHKKRAIEFLEAWKNRKWKRVEGMFQQTWLSTHNRKDRRLMRKKFQKTTITDYIINKYVKIGECMYDVIVAITFLSGRRAKMTMRIICETAPYTPSLEGEWNVNPISCLRIR